MKNSNSTYHFMALAAVVLWGTTFVSTKTLLGEGLTPADIMFYRFLQAYIIMWLFSPHFHWPKNFKDELLFIGAGIVYCYLDGNVHSCRQDSECCSCGGKHHFVELGAACLAVDADEIQRVCFVGLERRGTGKCGKFAALHVYRCVL